MIGTAAWVLVRAAFAFVSEAAKDVLGPPTLTLELPAMLALIAICSAFVVLDVLRRHERLLLANLGVSLGGVAVVGAIPALVAETAVTLLATIIGG